MQKWTMRTLILGCCLTLLPSFAQAQLFFDAEAVFLGRNNEGGTSIVSGADPISTNSGSYGSEPGYRLTIGGIFDNLQVDGTFTQISPWTSSLDGVFNNNVDLPTGMNFDGFLNQAAQAEGDGEYLNGPGTFDVSNRSNYRDAEIMIGSSYINRRWRLAGGYRYVQLDEKNGLGIFADLDEAVPGPAAPIGLTDAALTAAGATWLAGPADGIDAGSEIAYLIQSNTRNQMHGFQTLFGVEMLNSKWVTIEGLLKAGIYCNNMSGRVTETVAGLGPGDTSVYQRILSGNKTGAAFAGNLGLRAVIGITDYIDLVGGGEVLFLSGVALGDDQANGVNANLMGTNAYQVQNKGSLVAYGGTVGLRIFW